MNAGRDDAQREPEPSLEQQGLGEQLLNEVLDRAPIGGIIASTEANGQILYLNPQFTRITGYTTADIPTVADWIARAYPDPDYREQVLDNWARDTDPENMNRDVIYQVTCKNGRVRDVQFRANALSGGHMFVTALDVSDRLRSERALIDSEEKYSSLFHASTDAIIVHDLAGRIVDANPKALGLFGYSLDEFLAMELPSLHPEEERCLAPAGLQSVTESGCAHFRARFMRKDGSLFPGVLSAVRFEASGRQLVQGIVRDVSHEERAEFERRELESRLQHVQKMEAIGELAGGVAHDFNNMLTVILGNAELLELSSAPGSNESMLVEQIMTASRRAGDLTRQLLTFARRVDLRPATVDVHHMVQEVQALLIHGLDKRIAIVLDLKAADYTVRGDVTSLETALLNLGLNARDAIEGEGTITFSTCNILMDEAAVARDGVVSDPGEYIEIRVRDTGRGMPRDVQKRAFEPFFTTKRQGEGTGLGLATAYGAITGHCGSITFTSEEGKGTEFIIRLPLNRDEAVPPAEEETKTAAVGSGHILVVDDEDMVRDFAAAAVQSLGYSVSLAEDGEECVRVYASRRDEIDLVLLDLSMPKMDGREAFLELRKINPDVRVLIASGYVNDEVVSELLHMGAAGFLGKPYRIHELAQKLRLHMPGL